MLRVNGPKREDISIRLLYGRFTYMLLAFVQQIKGNYTIDGSYEIQTIHVSYIGIRIYNTWNLKIQ